MQRITDIYRRAGRNAATVSDRTVDTPNGTVDVVFNINEGDKTGVKEIHFVGNQAFSTGRLLGLMETTEMNFLSFFKTSDVYDPDRIAKDAEAIRRFYLKNGYADFRVIGVDPVYDPARAAISSRSRVEEGGSLPRRLGQRRIAHLNGVSDAALQSCAPASTPATSTMATPVQKTDRAA